MTVLSRNLPGWALSVSISVVALVASSRVAEAACDPNSCNTPCACEGICGGLGGMVFETDNHYDLSCWTCYCTRGECIKRGLNPPEQGGCYECCRDSVAFCEEGEGC
jgi:hypothetical protein